MSGEVVDISGSLAWEDGLPCPRWDDIEALVESRCEPEARWDAWNAVVWQWLAELGSSLGGGYEAVESVHFLVLSPEADATGRPVVRTAERCRAAIESLLGDVADFEGLGKSVVLVLRNLDHFYRYISLYFPEGEYGGMSGLHVRVGYPHVVLYGTELWMLEPTLAHELTHVSLHHLDMPQWLEEGLAQMFEHDVAGYSLLQVDARMARRQIRYWGRLGLDAFWRGGVFSSPGKTQELGYNLAEILVRLLVAESRSHRREKPRESQRRLLAFVRDASRADAGEAACREHLGCSLSDLAARFLGPGSWSPSLDSDGA